MLYDFGMITTLIFTFFASIDNHRLCRASGAYNRPSNAELEIIGF